MTPYEIIMAPFEVFLAPEGTAFPDPDTAPAAPWVLLGSNGKYNISEEGVTVAHEQSIAAHRTLGSTGPVKAARTEEDLRVSFTLEDMTAEEYGKILNNVVASVAAAGAGVPGHRDITLRQGLSVSTFAMLVRGPSSYGDSWNSQYQIPRVFQNANPTLVFSKGEAAGLSCEFVALEDALAATDAERFGKLVIQDADALP
jgi:hypothetical protein